MSFGIPGADIETEVMQHLYIIRSFYQAILPLMVLWLLYKFAEWFCILYAVPSTLLNPYSYLSGFEYPLLLGTARIFSYTHLL